MIRTLHRLTFTAAGQPIFDALTRRRYREAYRDLIRTQWLNRDELRRLQTQKLARVIEHAYRYSPLYQERLHAAGWAPGSPVDFELLHDLPALERDELQDRLDDIATVSRFGFRRVDPVASGGSTTGRPVRIFNDGLASDRKGAARLRSAAWAGYVPGARICYLSGPGLPLGSDSETRWGAAWDAFKGVLKIPHWDLSDKALGVATRKIQRFRPQLLASYPSSIGRLAAHIAERGLDVSVGAILLFGEMLTEPVRRSIEEVFGRSAHQAYGCQELGDIAGTCGDCGAMHVYEENVILETEPGTGQLLATDLTNLGTPLIRYRMGDVGRISDEAASCARGLRTLSAIEGRTIDVIELPGGVRISLMTLVVLFRYFPAIKSFQAWQERASGPVQLLVQTPTASERVEMHARLRANVPSLDVQIISVRSLPRSTSGKQPLFVKGRAYSGQEVIAHE